MKRLIVLVFVLPFMLALSEVPGNASEGESVAAPSCSASYCASCDTIGGICVQHATFCDCHV
jgi:hypothetical protein